MAIKLPELKKQKVIKPSDPFPVLPPERLTKEWLTEYERVMGKPYVGTAEAELFPPPAIEPPTKAPVAGVTPPQGFVWDYETGQYIPATLDLDVTRKFYQERPELLPEGVSPTLTPEDLDVLISEQEAKQEELLSTFKSVFPTVVEGMPEDDQIGIVSAFLTQLGENEAIQDWFVETILDIGRTEQTESLLRELGFDEPKLKEFFAEPSLEDEWLTGKEPEAVLQLEPEWENIRTGEVIVASEKSRRYPKGYEAELDDWRLTVETTKNYGSVFKVFAESLTKIPKQLGASILQAVQGQAGASVVDKDWADEWIEGAASDQRAFVEKVAQEYQKTRLPVNVVDVAELPQNIAFSLTSMGAGLAVGVPVALAPVPGARVAAWALGTAASGAVAYNMTTYQIMQQYLEVKNDEMMAKVGRGLTAEEEESLKKDFSNQAMKYGLWEAIPEAVSNLAFAKILTMPLGKMVGRNIASKIIGKLFSLYGEELLTETITQKGQSDIEVEAGLREGKITWVEAFKEVAPQTFLLTTILGGAGQIGVSSVNKIKQSLKKEIGESPVYDVIKENITPEIFAEVEAEAVIPEQVKEVKPAEVVPAKPTVPEPIPAKPPAPEVAYDASLEAFRKASREFTAIRNAYRAKEIGDEEYLKGKAAFDKASQEADAAEEAYIKAKAIPKAEVGELEVARPVATAIEEVTPKPEKAANIRLEKYPEEVRDTIKEWADTHGDEVRKATRGIVSDAQVRAEAERLTSEVGGDLAKLRKKWKPATAWNAEELVAIRSVLRTKTQNVLNAQKVARGNNSTQNLLKLELALKEQAAIQEMVHGLTAEAGRALRSFRQETFDAIRSNDVSRMEELLKKIRGREDTEKIAEMLGRLDPSDSIAVNKFIQELYKPHAMDYLIELFYNSILSGPKTHIVNSLSNTANAIFSPVERFVSALVDMPLAKIQGRAQERYLSEVPADIFGAIRGIPEGFRQFAYVIKNGISFDQATKWEFRQKAFRGKLGAVVSMPSRFLEGADALMKAINQRAALNAEAHRIASKEKLSGQVFEERVADLLFSPTEEMLKEANRIAEYRLFRQPPGKFGQTLMNLRDAVDVRGFRPLRFVMPFIRTPLNLVKYGLERTPLGFVNPKLWQNVAQKNPEAADQIARAMIGSIGLATLSWYFAAGMITGAPPRDRAERERFYREGKQPYAIRVGGFWVSYQRLEPFNQLLSMVAITGDMIRNNDKGVDEKILDAVNTFGQNFVSQTYMSSVSDLMEMISEPERYAGKWLNRFASSILIPMSAATRTAAMMLDQTVRDPQNVIETIEASIPGLSKNVQSKITALGEDIKRKSPQWFPINITPVEETVLSQELERLKYNIGFVGDSISGIKLSDAEQREYQILAGQTVKSDLEKLMLAPEYWQANDVEKEKMLRKVVDAARDWAKVKTREKIWASKITEDRMGIMETALKESDSQLGKVVSETPTFTHEPPNIYDLAGELDASYRSLLANIPEMSLRGIETPPTVPSWYAKERAKSASSGLPNKTLIEINAEAGKTTFEDYYDQWQKREKITDERELETFDNEYSNARLGNISRRQLELLRDYHKLDKAGQEKFLNGLSEEDRKSLTTNAYTDWLTANPKDNAQLAIWGEAKILTKEAYTEYNRLVRELDVVDSALPKLTLPPSTSIDTHFAYEDMVANDKNNSWEAQLLLKQDAQKAKEAGVKSYVEWRADERSPLQLSETPMVALELKTEKTYREVYDKITDADFLRTLDDKKKDENGLTEKGRYITDLKATMIGDMTYIDIDRKIEAIEKGTDDEPVDDFLVNAHIEYMRMQDAEGVGASTAEVMLYRVDNPEYNNWRMDTEVWGDKVLEDINEEKIPVWRIDARWRKEDAEYDALPTEGTARSDYLAENEEYRQDRRRREASQLKDIKTGERFPDTLTESYVAFYELPDKGKRRDRYLVDNPEFAKTMQDTGKLADIPKASEVPDVRYDEIYEQYQDLFDEIEGNGKPESEWFEPDEDKRKARDKQLRFHDTGKLTEFGLAETRRQAYGLFVPESFVEDYVGYFTITKEGKPEDYPKDVPYWEDDWWMMEHPDFYKEVYLGILGKQRKDYRKVPTRAVGAKYLIYQDLPTARSRSDYRFDNPDLEDWLLLTGKVIKRVSEERRKAELTPAERLAEEVAERLRRIEELEVGR